jgi:hypothetical protein
MNRRLVSIVGGAIFLLILAFAIILAHDNYLHKQEDLQLPSSISSYSDMGYYKIDPETILTSLASGDTNVFMPLPEDIQDVEEIAGISISWTQADFLKIASALGQFLWGDPMDLRDWSVYAVTFEGFCDDSTGLDYAELTYFKAGSTGYSTRFIEIHPYFGWVGWGNEANYPKPILRKWKSVDLLGAKITADDALRIASEHAKERFHLKDKCGVLMGVPENNDPNNWYLHVFGFPDSIVYAVNFETGDYTFENRSK